MENYYPKVMNYIRAVDNTADGAYDAGYYFCYHFEAPANRASRSDTRGDTPGIPIGRSTPEAGHSPQGRPSRCERGNGRAFCATKPPASSGGSGELIAMPGIVKPFFQQTGDALRET